jgi:hypothetical protein
LRRRLISRCGLFHNVSDVEEYFHIMTATVAELALFKPTQVPQPSEGKDDLDYLTNFERKFRWKAGRSIARRS